MNGLRKAHTFFSAFDELRLGKILGPFKLNAARENGTGTKYIGASMLIRPNHVQVGVSFDPVVMASIGSSLMSSGKLCQMSSG